MAIEFPCSRCGRQLRTSEENIGREAKCPECGSLTVIPAVSGGMQAPAGQFTAAPSNNPFASPAIGGQFASNSSLAAPGEIVPTKTSVGEVLSCTWQVFTTNIGKCLLFILVMLGIYLVTVLAVSILGALFFIGDNAIDPRKMMLVQSVAQVVLALPFAWIMLGVMRFFLGIARGANPSFSEIFTGGPFLLRAIGIYVSLLVLSVLIVAPLFIFAGTMLYYLLLPVVLVALIAVSLFVSQAFFALVDKNLGAMEAVSTSVTIMKGNIVTLILTGIVVAFSGALFTLVTLGLGVLVLMPFGMVLNAVFFLLITGQRIGIPGR